MKNILAILGGIGLAGIGYVWWRKNHSAATTTSTMPLSSAALPKKPVRKPLVPVSVAPPPPPDFSFNINYLSVAFNGINMPSNATYSWDFGDGTTSTDANPTHAYNTDGTYNVVLKVNNSTTINHSVTVAHQQTQGEINQQNFIAATLAKWEGLPAYLSGTVYAIKNGQSHGIPTPQAFQAYYGYPLHQAGTTKLVGLLPVVDKTGYYIISAAEFAAIPVGAPMNAQGYWSGSFDGSSFTGNGRYDLTSVFKN